jgi:uncharacterized protein (TIGR01777 family)
MKVFLTGGTGLVGRAVVRALIERGDEVVCVTRDSKRALSRLSRPVEIVEGDPTVPGPWQRVLGDCDAVVNLAGEPIAAKRWTRKRKALLRRSRLESTRNVAAAINASERVRVLVSASAVGYYGDGGAEPLYEETEGGRDFLGRLAHEWEGCALEADNGRTRVALLRTGLVLDREDGALPRMILPYRFGLGGPLGDGRGYVPWIHRHDLVRAILHILVRESMAGPVNAVVPDPPTRREFARTLGRVLGRPSGFTTPGFVLGLVLGEMSTLLLQSCRAVPKALRANEFQFEYRELEPALRQLLS